MVKPWVIGLPLGGAGGPSPPAALASATAVALSPTGAESREAPPAADASLSPPDPLTTVPLAPPAASGPLPSGGVVGSAGESKRGFTQAMPRANTATHRTQGCFIAPFNTKGSGRR